ncbi:hypothetical protein F5Y00DRAFT_256690 [Daldinia vernicosa]|uniref:uncharacterized protein n=1 Tax=Daldinia vernicosa TaxID=114800 RepID=UPI002007A7E8|nr:uncharacterized protein F5Y00DRAFT_256690 [Daldinia vernicosa]KAI0854191.1 hypothetical protein F5Y00DRAFT_256690 [Daldinia vernicosa]
MSSTLSYLYSPLFLRRRFSVSPLISAGTFRIYAYRTPITGCREEGPSIHPSIQISTMPDEDADYKRQVEEANQTLVDGLEAQVKVAEKGDDVEENSWEPFLNQLKGLVADGELLDGTRSEVEGFRDSLLGRTNVLLQSRGRELGDALNTPVRDD